MVYSNLGSQPTLHSQKCTVHIRRLIHTCIHAWHKNRTALHNTQRCATNNIIGRGAVYLCKDPAVRVTRYHLNCVVGKLEHLGLFESDDTAGFDGLLHRVGVMRDKVQLCALWLCGAYPCTDLNDGCHTPHRRSSLMAWKA